MKIQMIAASAMLAVLATPLAALAHEGGGHEGGRRAAVGLRGTPQTYGASYTINKPPPTLSADAPAAPAPSTGGSDFVQPDRSDDRN